MVIFLMPAQPIGLMADAPLLSGSEFALSACPLTLAKAAASSGSSSASSTSAQADRKEPFTYQEAVFGTSLSSTMPLLFPSASLRESL